MWVLNEGREKVSFGKWIGAEIKYKKDIDRRGLYVLNYFLSPLTETSKHKVLIYKARKNKLKKLAIT